MFYEFMAAVNLVLAVIGSSLNFRYALIIKRGRWIWLKVFSGLVCLYVAGIYTSYFVTGNLPTFEYTRPATTLMLAVISSGAVFNQSTIQTKGR